MQSGRIGQELIEGEDAVEAVRDFVYGSVPSSVEALNRKKGDSSSWERMHANQADSGHSHFVCNCKLAKSRGQRSCLKQFSSEELMGFHKESFGVYIQHAATNTDFGPKALGIRIHKLMWPLREPIKSDGTADEKGRSWKVSTWKLGNRVVCRTAWERAYGAAGRRYRTIYGFVQRGHAPHYADASQQGATLLKLMDRVSDAAGVLLTQKRSWAANWWKEILLLMDWMPSEQRIRIRGPGFKYLHANVYGPKASAVGMHLSYKTWKGCMRQGVHDVCLELPGSVPDRVSVGRAANHANFPECTTCLTRRSAWLSAAKSPASDPATVQVSPCFRHLVACVPCVHTSLLPSLGACDRPSCPVPRNSTTNCSSTTESGRLIERWH